MTRETYLPYGRQDITRADRKAVNEALCEDLITGGPSVSAFEEALGRRLKVGHIAAVSSGTAALHLAYQVAGVGCNEEVIMSPLTFAATANAALYLGAKPVFVDVLPGSLNIDPKRVREAITSKTRAVVAMHYAGRSCNMQALAAICKEHKLFLIEDACHALGAEYYGKPVGSGLANLSCWSFHPVKHVAAGEGGAVSSLYSPTLISHVKLLRNHGIVRGSQPWEYNIGWLGCNYRISDINCALARSQLKRLSAQIKRRRELAAMYDKILGDVKGVRVPQRDSKSSKSAWHLYVIRVKNRGEVFRKMRNRNIGVAVHYPLVYSHTIYHYMNCKPCPVAERAYKEILTLPLFGSMTNRDLADVVEALEESLISK